MNTIFHQKDSLERFAEIRTPLLDRNKINNKLTGCRLDCYIYGKIGIVDLFLIPGDKTTMRDDMSIS